ncbi:hypothetical protein LWI29_013864 [Acer saccharum]|uniref:Glycosyltransferase n=1 Tax=Acer saccharum TaxID=4024 RepID=A0AA39SAU1_ACESA|nr:hypothetical protein LWI29_013864 [Acer saccharum]
MEKKSFNPHVLFIPNTLQGHITPMVQFGKRLVSKGIKVTLVTTVYLSKSIHVDPECSIAIETISDGFDDTGSQDAGSIEACFTSFRINGSRTLAELIEKLADKGQPATAIVYDGLFPWVLDVAKQYGLFKAAFFNQTCAVNSIYYHVNRGLLKLPLTGSHISLPELPLLLPSETPLILYVYGKDLTPPDLVELVSNQYSNIDEADWLIFDIFYKMEEKIVDWMSKLWKVGTVGPTLPSMYLDKRLENDKDYSINLFEPKTSTCMSWLNDKPIGSVVYVAFGSVASPVPEQMEELAWGLKGINCYFLWVMSDSMKTKLPNKFIEEISDQGLVVSWCSQLEVLAHKSIGCFVTHCGLHSVMEAMSFGVPMVGMPLFVDQQTNGKFMEDVWRSGIRVLPDETGIVGRQVFQKSIKEIMEGEKGIEIKKNVMKWKELAKEAVDEGGSSDKNINEFVAKLLLSCS